MTLARRSLTLVAVLVAVSCTSNSTGGPEGGASAAVPVDVPHHTATYDDHGMPVGLHQYNPFTERLTSGAQPEGEEAFRNLAALGYRTILSVDGALPEVETAKRYGLRYVHVPIHYSGVKHQELVRIVKGIETSDGPVYLHCHHGKHRSAGALAAACVSLGLLTPEQAVTEMKISGTDPKYQGLFRDAMNAKPVPKEELAAISASLPESVHPDDLAAAMIEVDTMWDNMKASKAAKWAAPAANPDMDPPHEARMLWEQYREIARLPDAAKHGDAFAKFLADAESSARALEDALRAKDAKATEAAFAGSAKSCTSCHAKYRDN